VKNSVEKPMCPICKELAEGKLVNTQCGHIFHYPCLEGWVNNEGQKYRELKVCPTCGGDFDMEKNNPVYL